MADWEEVFEANRKNLVRENAAWCQPLSWKLFPIEQKISFPFAGIGGPERALIEGGMPFRSVNVIEIRKECMSVLNSLRLEGTKHVEPHDARHVPDEWLEDSDGLFGTAPCQSFSKLGKNEGFAADNGMLFYEQLRMVKVLSRRKRPLRWVVMENVESILGYLEPIQNWWSENMPHWTELQTLSVDCADCNLPHRRRRVFLVVFDSAVLMHAGGAKISDMKVRKMPRVDLEDWLDESGTSALVRGGLSRAMMINAEGYTKRMEERGVKHLCVVDVSRSPTGGFNNEPAINLSQPLTTKNAYLYIIRPPEVESSVVKSPGRLMFLEERARLCGVLMNSVRGCMSPRQLMVSFGNMVPVDMAGLVLEAVMDVFIVFLKATVPSPRTLAPRACSSWKQASSQKRPVKRGAWFNFSMLETYNSHLTMAAVQEEWQRRVDNAEDVLNVNGVVWIKGWENRKIVRLSKFALKA